MSYSAVRAIAFLWLFTASFSIHANAQNGIQSQWAQLLGNPNDVAIEKISVDYQCSDFRGVPVPVGQELCGRNYNQGGFLRDFDNPVAYRGLCNNLGDSRGTPFVSNVILKSTCQPKERKDYEDLSVDLFSHASSVFKVRITFQDLANLPPSGYLLDNAVQGLNSQDKHVFERYINGFGFLPSPHGELSGNHDQSVFMKFPSIFSSEYEINLLDFCPIDGMPLSFNEGKFHCIMHVDLSGPIWESITFIEAYDSTIFSSYQPKERFLLQRDFVDLDIEDNAYQALRQEVTEHFAALAPTEEIDSGSVFDPLK